MSLDKLSQGVPMVIIHIQRKDKNNFQLSLNIFDKFVITFSSLDFLLPEIISNVLLFVEFQQTLISFIKLQLF